MGRVKVESVVEKDPNSSLNPILVRFEHAPVKPDVEEKLDLNNFFGTAVYETDTSLNASRDLSHLNRSAFENRSRPSNGKDTKISSSVQQVGNPLEGEYNKLIYVLSNIAGSRGTKRKQVVALQCDAMTYIGTKGFDNPSLPSSTDDMMKTYIAVKERKRLRIFEVTPVTVSPYLKGHSHVVDKPKSVTEKTIDEKREATIDLIKSFGSKKKR